MYKIAIFASGSGSNALKIMEHFQHSQTAAIAAIYTNRKEAGVLAHASQFKIKAFYFPGSIWKTDPESILKSLLDEGIDFVILAGFLLKVPDNIVAHFTNSMLNIHPSLLPKYGGKGMYGMNVHEAVKAAGELESGITIHYVNEKYDDGNIVFQAKTALAKEDSANDIQRKVLALEHYWFPKVIAQELEKRYKS
jgi:phosphoribosylglycinamide formyltransferase-1